LKIEVETISDRCILCPDLDIRIETIYANYEPYERLFECVHVETCVRASRYAKEKEEAKESE